MIVEVAGFRKTSFTANDGSVISGTTLYVTYGDSNVNGVVCDRVFVSAARLGSYDPQLGDVVNLDYNRYGKINSVSLAQF